MRTYSVFPNGIIHLSLLLSLSACALGPDYKEPTAEMLNIPATWQGATATQAPNLARWWEQLNDPALSPLISEALANNLDLKIAQSRLKQAMAQREIAYAGQLPTASTSASATSGGSSGNTSDSYRGSLSTSWELDIFGGNARASEAAQADLEATQANTYGTRVALAAEVATTYYNIRNAQNRLDVAQRNLASQTETLQFIDWRSRAGLIDGLTLAQARTQRAQTAANIPALETTLANAKFTLAVLLGKAPGTLGPEIDEPTPLPKLPDQIAIGIPAETLRQRPDINAAERILAAETARVGVSEADLLPSFTLSGSLGLDALALADVLSGASIARSVVGSLAQTIFDGGARRQRLNIQNEAQEQAFLTYQATVLNALQEVESALVTLANNRARKTQLEIAARSARQADILAGQQYNAGAIDYQSRLETQRSRLSAEDSYASAQIDEITALIALYKAMGGGWQKETAQ